MQFSFPAKARSINPKTTLVVIFLVILLDQCGVLLIQPIYPELLHSLTGQSTADSALWMGGLTASYAVMQIIFAPVIGRLSDYYGRRKLLLLSMFAFAVDYAIMALAQNIYVLFLGRIVSGIAGSCVALGFAAVTDISSAEDRMKNLGVVYAAFGLGLVLGPIFGSIGVRFSLRGPLWLAVVFSIVNFLLIYYLFCETRIGSKEKKQGASGLIASYRHLCRYRGVKGLLLAELFILLGLTSMTVMWPYYAAEHFYWDASKIAYSLVVAGMAISGVQLTIAPWAHRLWGDVKSLLLSGVFFIVSTVLFLWVQHPINWYLLSLAVVCYALGWVGVSEGQTILSFRVPNDHQGELQGFISALYSLSLIITPLLMTHIFKYSIHHNLLWKESNIFVVAGLFCFLGFIIYVIILPIIKED